jgi:LmbE family N-acetylglucosaminyl deacetylase/SAM-dependent methyltransferase
VVSFSHLDEGTGEDRWLASGAWSSACPLELGDVQSLLVVSAHPDDESLAAGGLIAMACAQGIPVQLVVATDGEASHPASPTHSPATLRSIRRAELTDAMLALAPQAEVEFLGLPDSGLAACVDELVRHLEIALGSRYPAGLLIVAPWEGDGHSDHQAAGSAARIVAARRGLRLLEYPIWMWHWADPESSEVPWADLTRLPLTAGALRTKRTALAAHRSQIRPLSNAPGDETLLSEAFQRHFDRDEELFFDSNFDADRLRSHQTGGSLPAGFFDDFYEGNTDPWGFDSRWYEKRKRALTVAALPRERFRNALEVGCSTGALTAELASHCERLLGIDIAGAPIARAKQRLQGVPSVDFAQLTTPAHWPAGSFDLIVLSEVGYYWGEADLNSAINLVVGSLADDGVVLACHWRHPVAEYPLGGDAVHRAIRDEPRLARTVLHEEDDFVLEVFMRPPARSVARETGLVG